MRRDPMRHPVEHRPYREAGGLHLPKAALDDPHPLVAQRDVGHREGVGAGREHELAAARLGPADLGPGETGTSVAALAHIGTETHASHEPASGRTVVLAQAPQL